MESTAKFNKEAEQYSYKSTAKFNKESEQYSYTRGASSSGGAHPAEASSKRKRIDTPAQEDETAKHPRPA
jgi:hypothetical protein